MSFSWEPQKVERKELEKVTSTERKRHCVGMWISHDFRQKQPVTCSIDIHISFGDFTMSYCDLF